MASLGARAGAASLGRAGAAVTAANVVVNLAAYLVPLLGARYLTSDDLGALATAMALFAIATVPGMGLQTAIAVSVARGEEPANLGRTSVMTALLCGAPLLLATPLLVAVLDLPVMVPPLIAAMTVPIVLACRSLGELQGRSRFSKLAVGLAVIALGRYAGVVVGLAAGLGLVGSLVVGVAAAWLAFPVLARLGHSLVIASGRLRGGAVFTAASATLAMLVASYADLILARTVLPAAASGAYAVGAVLTRGAIWAPQVITMLALPRLAQGHRRTLMTGLCLVAGAGLALVGLTAVASELAVRVVGGSDYLYLTVDAPWFAALGAVYAVIFFLLNAQIAASARWPSAPLWLGVVTLPPAILVLGRPSIGSVLACALLVAVAAATAMLIRVLRTAPPPATPPSAALSSADQGQMHAL
ncbi:polysaccharide biosynthesis protein [Micromonospora sp. CPCC 206061]|uniref:polysaccharide biosynthesis protein n=1 Tax=Micromonospora sp. CPCC 206061 TaxID=3122410 RepID=UPI002FF42DC7